MLHTPVPYPQTGSTALLAGETVKIHQWIDAGETAVVITGKGTYRAGRDELAPPREKTLFERWMLDRIVAPLHSGTLARDDGDRTPVTEAQRDYMAWLQANGGHADDYPTSEYAFVRMMMQAGYGYTTGYWRNAGDTHARTRRLFKLSLKKAPL